MHTGETAEGPAIPRRLARASHLPLAGREHCYRAARDPVARSHWHMLWLLTRGEPSKRVAETSEHLVNWVRQVAARYTRGGP